jgi:hypothetical protein
MSHEGGAEAPAMTNAPTIVVLDGHTINPGDNPWTPVEELGRALRRADVPWDREVGYQRESAPVVHRPGGASWSGSENAPSSS